MISTIKKKWKRSVHNIDSIISRFNTWRGGETQDWLFCSPVSTTSQLLLSKAEPPWTNERIIFNDSRLRSLPIKSKWNRPLIHNESTRTATIGRRFPKNKRKKIIKKSWQSFLIWWMERVRRRRRAPSVARPSPHLLHRKSRTNYTNSVVFFLSSSSSRAVRCTAVPLSTCYSYSAKKSRV